MEFDLKDGLFLREVRQLGFRKLIPVKMIENVELGKRFYREALTLKQIAHFYNNIFSQNGFRTG
jgi:dynein heavy chain 2